MHVYFCNHVQIKILFFYSFQFFKFICEYPFKTIFLDNYKPFGSQEMENFLNLHTVGHKLTIVWLIHGIRHISKAVQLLFLQNKVLLWQGISSLLGGKRHLKLIIFLSSIIILRNCFFDSGCLLELKIWCTYIIW